MRRRQEHGLDKLYGFIHDQMDREDLRTCGREIVSVLLEGIERLLEDIDMDINQHQRTYVAKLHKEALTATEVNPDLAVAAIDLWQSLSAIRPPSCLKACLGPVPRQ